MDIRAESGFSFRGNQRTEPGLTPVRFRDDPCKFQEVKMALAISKKMPFSKRNSTSVTPKTALLPGKKRHRVLSQRSESEHYSLTVF